MRILSIRGRNLASLHDDFEVDLAQGPLGRVGLFAITGPTGSGKSTLLDAMCLALFGKTPRSKRASTVKVLASLDEDHWITAQDPRNLLRRGCAEGYAEVCFVGKDGERYRSRWSVRRARNRANGRLQKDELELRALRTGERLGGTYTQTEREISKRLGLTFEQFRRSALLAQGDFAAFLLASAKERAALLERMTDTGVYAKLSTAAHERYQKEQRTLTVLSQRISALGVLDPAPRLALQEAIQATEAEQTQTRTALESLGKQLQWFETARALTLARDAAQSQVRERERAALEAKPWLDELDELETLLPLRGDLRALDAATEEAQTATGKVAESIDSLDQSQTAEERAASRLLEAQRRSKTARDALVEAGPQLNAARALDQQVARADADLKALGARLAKAKSELGEAGAEMAHRAASIRALESERADAETWLSAQTALEPIARGWDAYRGALMRLARSAAEANALEADLARLRDITESAEKTQRGALAAFEKAEQRLKTHSEHRQKAEAAIEPGALGRLTDQQKGLSELRQTLSGLLHVATRHAEAQERAASAEAALQAGIAAVSTARKEAQELEETRPALEAALDQARKATRLASDALSLGDRRQQLQAGEACPLCGATDHPFVTNAPSQSVLKALQEEEAACAHRVNQLGERLAGLSQQITSQEARCDEHRQARKAQLATVKQAAATWEAALTAPITARGLGEVPHIGAAQSALEVLGGELAELDSRIQAAQERARRAEQARDAETRARKSLERVRRDFETARDAAVVAASERDQRTAEWRQSVQNRDQQRAALAEPLSGREAWRDQLTRDPRGLATRLEAQIKEWAGHGARRDKAQEGLATQRTALGAVQARREASQRRCDELMADREALTATRGDLAQRRGELWGGRQTGEVEAGLQHAVKAADQALEAARQTAQEASEARVKAAAALQAAQERVKRAEAGRQQARAALDQGLEAQHVDEARLRKALQRDAAWVEARRADRAALQKAQIEAQTRLGERAASLEAHQAREKPEEPEEALSAAHSVQREALGELTERADEQRLTLRLDDERRAETAALQAELDAATAAAKPWEQLNALIGQADGSKFQRFAQSLTLETLLGFANQHLDQLAPRYQLMRVPGSDLDLQIMDRDMGDEVRSLASLSGGESFLASLALALGLASMTSSAAIVESLFIDEGFGSLDQATLQIALATLAALEASGRQVAVISHVDGLAGHIGAEVRVVRTSAGRSHLEVHVGNGGALDPAAHRVADNEAALQGRTAPRNPPSSEES